MEPGSATALIGLALLLGGSAVWWILRATRNPKLSGSPLSGASTSPDDISADAVVTILPGGRVGRVSRAARDLMALNGRPPDLERLVRDTLPAGELLRLCREEGSAVVRIRGRVVEARSHARGPGKGFDLRLREWTPSAAPAETERLSDTGLPLAALEELDPDAAAARLIDSLIGRTQADWAQLTVWDPERRWLVPKGSSARASIAPGIALPRNGVPVDSAPGGPAARERVAQILADPPLSNSDAPESAPRFHSLMAFPLLSAGELLGTAEFYAYAPDAFSQADLRALEPSIEAAALILRNALFYREQVRRSAEAQAQAEISKAAVHIADPSALVEELSRALQQACPAQWAGFLIHNPSLYRLEPWLPFAGLPDDALPALQIPIPRGVRSRSRWFGTQPFFAAASEVNALLREVGLAGLAHGRALSSVGFCPIGDPDRHIGWVMVAREDGGGWDPADRLRIEALALQSGRLLAGGMLISEGHLRLARADAVRRVAELASATPAQPGAARSMVETAASALQAPVVAVLLLDEPSARVRLHPDLSIGVEGDPAGDASGFGLHDPDFTLSSVGSLRPARWQIRGVGDPPPAFHKALMEQRGFRSALAVPIPMHGRAAGEMAAFRPEGAFNDADEEFLAGCAAQLAGLLERSRLAAATDQSLHRRIEQLTALTRISRELNTSIDLPRLLRQIHTEALRVTGAECGRIALMDPDRASGRPRPLLLVGENETESAFTPLEEDVLRAGVLRQVRGVESTGLPEIHDGIRAALLLPILFGTKTVGLIHLHTRQADGFDLPSQEFAQTMALQVAIAVGNAQRSVEHAQMETALQRKSRLLRALHRNESLPQSAQPLPDRLEAAAQTVQDCLGLAPVLVGSVEGDRLRWLAAAGLAKGAWNLLREDFFPSEMMRRVTEGQPESGCIALQAPSLDPDFQRIVSGFGVEGKGHPLLVAPLRSTAGELIGALAAASAVGSAPGADLLESLETVAAQAAAAIQLERSRSPSGAGGAAPPTTIPAEEHDRLRDLELRLTRLRSLAQVTEAISEPSEPQALLQSLADHIREAFAIDLVILAEDSENGPRLRLTSGTPPPDLQIEMLLGQNNPILAVFQRGTPVLARSLEENPVWQNSALLSSLKARSFLCFPIRARQKTAAAALLISRNASTPFLPGDADVFMLLGEQAATLLENARLLEETRRRLREGNVLLDFSRQVAGLDLPLILQALADGIRNALPEAEGAMVALWEETTGDLAVRAVSGYSNPHRMRTIRCRPGEGPLGVTFRGGRPMEWPRVNMAADYNLTTENLEAYRNGAGGMVPLSAVGVPLLAGERILGVLLVENFTGSGAFSSGTQDVALSLADQAALALEKARLFQEMTERTRQLDERATHLALLNRLTGAAISTSSEKTLLQIACRELASAFDVPQTAAALLEEGGATALVIAESVYPGLPSGVGARIPVRGVEPVEAVLQTRAPMQVENAADDVRLESMRGWLASRRTRSILFLPILVGGEAAGLILVESPEPHPFSLADLSLAQTISAQLGQALENVRLHQSTLSHATSLEQAVADRTAALEREHRRAEALLRISTELVASLDLELVLNRALQLVNEAIGADQAAIVLNDPDTQKLVFRAALDREGAPPPGGRGLPFQVGEGLAGWVIQQRQPVILPDLTQDKRWINLYPGDTPRYRSALAVPLTVGADALGALLLLSDNPAVFNPEQLTLVSAAANQVAAAINNAELYRLIRDQAERLGGLVRTQQVEARKSRAMLEAIADGVMVTGPEHSIVLFNDAAERILGLERNRVKDRPAGEYVGLFGRAGRPWIESLGRWKDRPAEIPAGEYLAERITLENRKVISVHLAPISSGEEYLGAVAVFRDITQDVEVDRLKSEFVATVSHELRTPMTAIKGYVEILLMGATGPLNDSQQNFLNVVKENTERLEVLVNDLLDVSRIEAGHVKLNRDVVEPGAIVTEAADALRERCRRSGKTLEVRVEAAADLPTLSADHARLEEILGNLTENAFLYTPDGGTVTLRAFEAGGSVQFDIADTGIGIPPADQTRIFERFFRGEHPLVMAAAGTGLGLSITQRLVEMHGGKIWMESEGKPGSGSVFHVRLPHVRVESG